MLRRKIEKTLLNWKNDVHRKPLVIRGLRQCGKTFIVRKFVQEHYEHEIYVNFILNPKLISAFTGNKDVDTIMLNLSALIPNMQFVQNNTCIILDEIQDCPDARTALKSFMLDRRYDVIATGSLLGVKGYGEKQKKEHDSRLGKNSIPVGYETVIDMYPLDFEEFLWGHGISDKVIAEVRKSFINETPVPEGIHKAMMDLLHRYVVVGGLPEVVNTFLQTQDIGQVVRLQKSIISEYEDDMVKYAEDRDKSKIRECFESIPAQLAKEYKKFQYSVIKSGARASQYAGSLQWLEDAGVICRCYNTQTVELPFEGNADRDCFKVYVADIGILMAMFDFGVQAEVLNGNLYGYKGAIFENLMADFLCKSGQKLFYFHKDSGLEIDFLIKFENKATLVEVKATSGKAKSMNTVLKNKDKYHVEAGIKLGAYNVRRKGNVLTIPLYMGFLLKDDVPDIVVPPLNIEEINKSVGE